MQETFDAVADRAEPGAACSNFTSMHLPEEVGKGMPLGQPVICPHVAAQL